MRDDEIQNLIEQLQVENSCSANKLALFEDLTVCTDLTDDRWEVTFFAEISVSSTKSVYTEDTEEGSYVESESDE